MQSFIYLTIVTYSIATIIKISIIPSQQDFLRNTLFIIGAMHGTSCILFLDNPILLKGIHSRILKLYPYIFIFIFLPFMNIGASLVDSLVFYIAMMSLLPRKYKWITWFAIIFVIIAPGQRMPLLRIMCTLLFYILFKYNLLKNKRILNIVNIILLLIPIVAFISASFGKFNILDTESYMGKVKYGNESLTDDTRTYLYQEAIESSINHNYIIYGRTFGYGYDSDWSTKRAELTNNGIMLQRNAEVFIINIYTWMGLIGIILFAILFFIASQKAINKSNNMYVRYIGILVSLQWIFCWIENCMATINFNQLIMWMEIAICLSPYWRNLKDNEFKLIIKNIFSK